MNEGMEILKGFLDLPGLRAALAADHLIGNARCRERLFERPRLGVGPVDGREVRKTPGPALFAPLTMVLSPEGRGLGEGGSSRACIAIMMIATRPAHARLELADDELALGPVIGQVDDGNLRSLFPRWNELLLDPPRVVPDDGA